MEVDFDRDARYWLGLYELELARHIRELCVPGSACFDLGSASGFYALVFARRGAARVLAVEADPTTCERLRRNVAANPGARGQRSRCREELIGPETDPRRARISARAASCPIS